MVVRGPGDKTLSLGGCVCVSARVINMCLQGLERILAAEVLILTVHRASN